jgi:hypothetical protein
MAPASTSGATVAITDDTSGSASERRGLTWAAVGIWVLFVVPFVVALAALAHPRWFPVLDLAQTEVRVRDVWSSHPPLIGLQGRIGSPGRQGSHPGPMSFWMLWPFYQLFGATSWALQAASASLNLLAVGAVLWMARRRGGIGVLLGVATALALLVRFYGPSLLTQPWNPYMPMLWWLVFVVAVWSVVCDDLPMLPVAAFAGSFCLQTHISYTGLVPGLAALALAYVAWATWRRRETPGVTRCAVKWVLVALGTFVVLWLPPVIQQITGSEGNLAIIWDYFTNPPDSPIGISEGVRLVLLHLNPWRLIAQQEATTGSVLPGALFLVGWGASAVVAWRLRARARALFRLDAVLVAILALGVVTVSRIFGYIWYYLMLWLWAVNALMLVAVAWTVVALVAPRIADRAARAKLARGGAVAVAAIGVLALIGFAVDASNVEVPDANVSRDLAAVVNPTIRALDSGDVPGGGRDGRYLITWVDPVHIGSSTYGLQNELERAGFDVRLPEEFHVIITPTRVFKPGEATGVIHLAVGDYDIEQWRAKPGVEEVAFTEPRNAAQRAEYRRLRARVIRELKAAGLSDLVPNVDMNLFVARFQPEVPHSLQAPMERMIELGQPTAIFIGPPSSDPKA